MQVQNPKTQKNKRGKRGRPKVSTLSKSELTKRRVREWRKRERKENNLVAVEVWIPKHQRAALKTMGKETRRNLSALAQKAFALLITGK
jgi:hypothetical protein